MNQPIRRIAVALYALFAVLLASVSWIQVVRADELRRDERNARPALSARGKERGLIVSSDGVVLARSIEDPDSPLSFTRVYPEGEPFAHVVGFESFLVGSTGIEAAYSDELRSRRDLTFSDLLGALLGQDLQPQSVELTIHAALQQAAYEALDGQTGAVVALDPRTGAVLAMVSSPSYDPTLLVGDDAAANWEDLLATALEPMRDRATRELFAPGSTFKAVVAATALDTGAAGPETEFPDPVAFPLPGSTATISNFDGRVCNDGETVTLARAFIRSCNTVFADLATRLGAADIDLTATALGFNRDFDFPWDIPRAAFPGDALEADPAALAQSGIGERDVRATPLHMAMVAATIANNGVLSAPRLVQRTFDVDGNTIRDNQPVSAGRAMESATATILAQMMERVVTEGTGRAATVPGVRVAGKTGTAQGSGGGPEAWFIGFAPVDSPTIALAVLVADGGNLGESATGGGVAAPIAAELIARWLGATP